MTYLPLKAWHIIFVVTWFSGLFYLPRLYVYHAMSDDATSQERFKIMERKLYYGIVWPSGILATICGFALCHVLGSDLLKQPWLQAKIGLVALTWVYHFLCGHFYKQFKADQNSRDHVFYRYFNEIPVLFLVGIVFLVILRPTLWSHTTWSFIQ